MKRRDKKVVQIGGILCPCCTIGKPCKCKKAISRRDRRKVKQTIKGET